MPITHFNGSPWALQSDFNTSSSTDITGWTSAATGFPNVYPVDVTTSGLEETFDITFPVVVTKSKVYVLTPEVQVASVDSSGVVGAFSDSSIRIPTYVETPTYPNPPLRRTGGTAFVTRDTLYYVGGADTWAVRDQNGALVVPTGTASIYSSTIASDGTIGSFSTESNALPAARAYGSVVVTKNRVYYLGGLNFNGTVTQRPQTSVYYADIDADGNLGSWSTSSNSLYAAIAFAACMRIGDKVYLIGGRTFFGPPSSNVYVATIDSSGVLGTWSIHNTIPTATMGATAFVTANTVFVIGGTSDDLTYWPSTNLYKASLTGDSIGSWSSGTSLGDRRVNAACFLTSSRVYLLTGKTHNGSYPYIPSSSNDKKIWYASFLGGLNDYSGEIYELLPFEQNSAWAVKAAVYASTSWAVLNGTTLSSVVSWKIKKESPTSTGWAIHKSLTVNTSWQVLEFKTETASTSWNILASLVASVEWRTPCLLVSSTSWKIKKTKSDSTAWITKNSFAHSVAWTIKILKTDQSSWAILSPYQLMATSSWKIRKDITVQNAWSIKSFILDSTGWSVLTDRIDQSSWAIHDQLGDVQTSWAIKDSLVTDASWHVYSLDFPMPIETFFIPQRERSFLVERRDKSFPISTRSKTFSYSEV